METINHSEKRAAEISAAFIFNVGAHCDDKTIVAPAIRQMVESAPEDKKDGLKEALGEIHFAMMLLGGTSESFAETMMECKKTRDAVRLVAEAFAVSAQATIPTAILKMALPDTAKNHRARQILRRKSCPALAGLCTVIKAEELRIGL
jgi:hypothetical protein